MNQQDATMIRYLDNAATTHLDPAVKKAMDAFQSGREGNASSLHAPGVYAATGIERARETIARKLGASPDEIVFTSGGTESNNFALKGIAWANRAKGTHLLVSRIEHPSVLKAAEWLQSQGFSVDYIPVDAEGFVRRDDVIRLLRKETILVSVMHANNEIGTREPIEEIGAVCRERNVYFHTDACQSFTKLPLNAQAHPVDLISLNAHKIHGPRGVGALYIRKGVMIDPLFHGGGQERDLRSGTHNTEGIAGFGTAVELARIEDTAGMEILRNYCIAGIRAAVGDAQLNGPAERRLCNNVNLILPYDSKAVFTALNNKQIAISTGSACSANKNTPSHVLTAIGRSADEAKRSIRISLSRHTTREDIDCAIDAIRSIVSDERLKA